MMMRDDELKLAARLRDECVFTALAAVEDAGMQGLCAEGRLEAALDALRRLDPAELLGALERDGRQARGPT